MTGDELHALKDLPAPEPREAARAQALAAALAAFDAAAAKNADGEAQGNAAPSRLTLASTQTQRSRLMRAKFINYKIAASIAVLIVAVPMALHMWRQEARDMTGARPVIHADRQAAVRENLPAAAGQASVPTGEKSIYDKLTPDGTRAPLASVPGGISLEQRFDEALKRAQSTGDGYSGSPAGRRAETSQPTVVRSESYQPDGTRVDSRPVIKPGIANIGTGLPYPFNNAPAPSPASPPPAASAAQPHFAIAPAAAPAATGIGADSRRAGAPHDKSAAYDVAGSQWVGFNGETGAGSPVPAPAAPARIAQESGYSAPGLNPDFTAPEAEESRDRFEAVASNPVKQVAAEPVSTFSIDVDTASYSLVRRSLLAGRLPPKDAVRVEEMINYFPYAYPRPESAATPFQPTVTVTPAPWKPTNKLVHIGIKGYEIAAKERPRANLVLLIDVSGSMEPEDRLPLLKNAFRMLLDELKPDDTVGIVTYASHSGVALEPTRVAERGKIADVLGRLSAGGSTAGGAGLQDAYRLAEMNFDKSAVNRVILATDGDFNVGITDREQLKRFIEAKRQSGIYLSVLGVGRGNYNDRLMQTLAQNGNGVAAYADTLNEARKVLVEEASSSLFPIANDVKIQIEFNPAQVSEYRLIGYETRALKREDFNNDKVDAGDIGSGHTVTAIYEVTPVGAPKFVDDLRYRKPEAQPARASGSGGELAFLKIRYKLPGEDTSKLIATAIASDMERPDLQAAPEDVRFSIAVAAFGQLLRGEPYTGGYSLDDVVALAQTARGPDPFGYRAEFLNLVRLAKSARQ
ncbi:MAG: vWA domain-containing protein [Rhodomicrobium sp.]